MPVTGNKKVIQKEKFGGKTGVQFCIDGVLVEEVLKNIPKGIRIIGGQIMLVEKRSNHKIIVPTALKRLGISYMHEQPTCRQASILFDEISAEALLDKVRKAGKAINIDPKTAYFRRLAVANDNGAGSFKRVTKEIKPDETDLRKKLVVLGLSAAQGKIQSLLADLSAKKYTCDIQEVVYRTAICKAA